MRHVLFIFLAGIVVGCAGGGGAGGERDSSDPITPDTTGDIASELVIDIALPEAVAKDLEPTAEVTADTGVDTGPDLAPNQAPTALFVQPEDGALFNVGDEVILEAEVADDYDSPEQLQVLLESSLDEVLLEGNASDTGRVIVTLDDLSAGEHIISLTVTDSDELSGQVQVSLFINSPPVTPEVHLEPFQPKTLDDIVLLMDSEVLDPDGDEVEIVVEWFKDGEKQDAFIGETLSHTLTSKNEQWGVVVKTFDGNAWGAVSQDKVTVVNTPPAVLSAFIGPQEATVQTELTCVPAGWDDPDGDPEGYSYGWAIGGQELADAVDETLAPGLAAKGDKVTCIVTPTDGDEEGEPVSSPPRTIDNSAPSGATATLVPAKGDVTTTFECIAEGAVDPDGDLVGYGLEWIANDQALPGAQSPTYDGALQAKGDTLFCRVVPTDFEKDGPATDSNVVTLDNATPTVTQVLVLPNPATVGTQLSCTPQDGADPDAGDIVTFGYAWFLNGEIAAGLTTAVLPLGLLQKGATAQCEAAPFDGLATGDGVLSDIVTIDNSLPVLETVDLTPPEGTESTVFTCTPQGWYDADDDLYEVRFEWFVNDQLEPEADDGTLDGQHFDAGDTVQCLAVPKNGDQEGVALESESAAVVNSAPVLQSVMVAPPSVPVTIELECIATGLLDADPADTPWIEYAWYKNGQKVDGETQSTFDPQLVGKDSEVSCGATPVDASGPGAQLMSPPALIVNTLPMIQSVSIDPPQGSVYNAFSCVPSGWLDADGDPEQYDFTWTLDGQVVPGATLGQFWSAEFKPGNWIGCTATPVDDDGSGGTMGAAPVQIVNTPPSLEAVVVEPVDATTDSTLTCSPSGWSDAEGDPETYEVAWLVDGVKVDILEFTLAPDSFESGDEVVCKVTPVDPFTVGPAVYSAPLVIGNSAPSLATVHLFPDWGRTNELFQCIALGYVDADGDPDESLVDWLISGEVLPDNHGWVLGGDWFSKGDTVACKVTPYDGKTAGEPVTSAPAPIVNSLPQVWDVTLDPPAGTHGTQFTCVHHAPADADNDDVEISYQWHLNGELLEGAIDAELTWEQLAPGDKVSCTATPYDQEETGSSVSSDEITLDNSKPLMDSVTLSPEFAVTTTEFECQVGGVSDPDGDEVAVFYAWYVNGLQLEGAEDSTLSGEHFTKNKEVSCTVSLYDGHGWAVASSNKVIVANSPPGAPIIALSPGDPTVNDDLVCFVQEHSFDLDGEIVDYEIDWYLNDIWQEGLTENVLSSALTDHCDAWRCKVTPLDSDGPGESAEQLDFIAGAPEWCDGKDNDCNQQVDEGLGTTTCGLGLCVHTVDNCADGQQQQCDPLEGAVDEVCDGSDNNCDGQIDEQMGATTCGLGPCEHTVDNCVDGAPQVCDALEGSVPEECDLQDNDCDGNIDNDLGSTTCGLGECHHTLENCVDGQPQVCDPLEGKTAEVCDGKDNDCDGEFDNGFFNESLPCPYFDAVTWRLPITVSGSSSGPLADFEVKIPLSFVDTMRTDFGDVRFGDANHQQLSYWKASFTSSDSAVFWVKAPEIPQGPAAATIYAYWGNPDGQDQSDIHGTFLFGDDFEDADWTAANWSHLLGTWTVSQGVLNGSGDDAVTRTAAVISENNRVVEVRIRTTASGTEPWDMGWLHAKYKDESNDVYGLIYQGGSGYFPGDVGISLEIGGGFTGYDTKAGPHPFFSAGIWHDLTVILHDSNGKLLVDGAKFIDANDGNFAALTDSYAGVAAHDSTSQFDNFRVRKAASPEPGVTVGNPEGVCSSCQ